MCSRWGPEKTLKSILISVGVRLSAFNLPQIARLTYTDDLHLEELGEKKVALFCIPDSDRSLNYLVGMIYGQLIQTLYYVADRKYKGRLPVPVHLLIDEAPNIAPAYGQLPAMALHHEKPCHILRLHRSEYGADQTRCSRSSGSPWWGCATNSSTWAATKKETHKYVSELMGKETLDTNTYGHSRGRSGSFSVNDQQTGRELLAPR